MSKTETETDSQTQTADEGAKGRVGGGGVDWELGASRSKQNGETVRSYWHRELRSVICAKAQGKRILKRVCVCVCVCISL